MSNTTNSFFQSDIGGLVLKALDFTTALNYKTASKW